ncbi:heparinase II/III family protein [Parasediminibacterium sp. JCM 36343]|uniref:heparinase II/III family protein n=1 Tax=Parasediminibacterium sp. JCM 36343 TaxID=3374279 RepID=UPI00397B8A60
MKFQFILFLVLAFTVTIALGQTNYYYQSGNVDAVSSWALNSNGTGGSPANFTAANQVFNIAGTKVVTSWNSATATWTIGSGSKVVVGDGTNVASLSIPSGNSISGTVDVQVYAKLYVESISNAPFIAGAFSSSAATTTSNSSLIYDGATNQYLPAGNYQGALSISGTGTTVTLNGSITVGNGGNSSSNSTITMASGTTLITNGYGVAIKKGFTVPSGATVDFGSNASIQPYSGYAFAVNAGATVISSSTSGLDGNINLFNTTTAGWFNAASINYIFNGASTTKMFCSIVAATTASSAVTTSTSIPVTSASNIQIGQSIYNASTLIGTVSNISGNTITSSLSTSLASGAELNFRNPPAFGTYSTSGASTGTGVTFTVASASGIVVGQSIYVNSGASSAGTVTGLSGNTITAILSSSIATSAYLNFRHSATALNVTTLSIGANNTLNTPVTISGDLTLGANATLADNGNVISLSGNIAGTGNHAGVGEILMTGAGKNIAGVGLGNLEVAVGSGNAVTLTGPASINGTLTLTAGYLNAGNNNLNLSGSALNANATSCIAGAGSNNYIVLGSGLLKIQGVNSSATKNPSPVIFPIGNATTSYTPITFTGTTNAPDITVGLSTSFTNALNNSSNVVNRQWSILSSIANATSLTYQYYGSNITGTLSTPILGVYTGSYSENILNSPIGSNPYTIATTAAINLPAATAYTGIGNAYTFALAPPTIGTATSTASGQATIAFTPSSLNSISGTYTYSVVSTPSATITQSGNTTSPITVSGLTNGTSYTFQVIANNGTSNSVASAASNAVTPQSNIPTTPTNISASMTTAGGTSATVAFTPSSYMGSGASSINYTVTASPGNITATGTISPIVVNGLSKGVLYTFTVKATNNLSYTSATSTTSNSVWLTGYTPYTGLVVTDSILFAAMNLNYPGLDSVRYYVAKSKYDSAKYYYHQYRLSSNAPQWFPLGTPSGNGTDTRAGADSISLYNIIGPDNGSGFQPPNHRFGAAVTNIQWFPGQNGLIAPTDVNNANYWGSMERFYFWRALYGSYMTTKNENYTKAWVNQMCNWVASFPVDITTSDDANGNIGGTNPSIYYPFQLTNAKGAITGNSSYYYPAVLQNLQEGCRMEDTWMNGFYTFLKSPSFVDSAVATFAKGILWHGWRLNWGSNAFINTKVAPSNHQILGAAGLAVAAMLFPEFNDAPTWQQTAFNLLAESMDSAIYPDGAETELAPGYHNWTRDFFMTVSQIATINHVALPSAYLATLKKMYWYDVYLMQPSGLLPPTNDNSDSTTAAVSAAYTQWGDPEFLFASSGGTQGKAPDAVSYRFPYAGFNVMRSGWDKNANYLFFKNGPIGAWYHGHEGDLDLYLSCFGSPLLIEGGAYTYDHSQWQVYDYSTEAHNTITVDGKDQHREDDSTVALHQYPQKVVTSPSSLPWISNFVADYTCGTYNDGYQAHAFGGGGTNNLWTGTKDYSINHNRHVFFLKPYYYVVTDFLEGSGTHTFNNYFNLNAPAAYLNSTTNAATTLNTLTPAQLLVKPIETNGLSAKQVMGQTSPFYVGWIAHSHTPIPTVIYTKKQAAPATFSTFLYPYNTSSTPSVNTTVLTNLANGVWGSTGTTQYENFAIAMRRYDTLKYDTITLTAPFSFSAYARVSIVRKQIGGSKTILATFDSLTKYYDDTTNFTPTQGNYILLVDSLKNHFLYSDNNIAETITFSKPVSTPQKLASHQWFKISSVGITDVSSPIVAVTPVTNTVLIPGDTVTVTANIANTQIPITAVSFYDGPIQLVIDSIAPYTFAWAGTTTTGFHNLTAKVTNLAGQTVTSPISTVSVGTFEAENFSSNTSGTIAVDSTRSNNAVVKNIAANGSLSYNLTTARSGKFSLSFTLLNNLAINSISVTVDGGAITNGGVAVGSLSVPTSSAYQTITIPAFDIASTGNHILNISFGNSIAAIDYMQIYWLNYYPIPGLIQAQNYTYTGNLSTNSSNSTVALSQNPESTGGGTYIGKVDSNWVSYTVNVAAAGTYQLQFSMTNPYSSGTQHVDIASNGTLIQSNLIPAYTYTSGSPAYFYPKDTLISFANAGQQTLKLSFYVAGGKNFAWINFAPIGLTTSITSPATNATFSSGSNITINSTAAATSSSVSKVEFYNGDILLGTDNVYPYNFTWANVPSGTFRITTRAYDAYGNSYISNPITITVTNKPPTVSITSPFNLPTTIMPYTDYFITANANDSDGTIAKVDYFNNGTLIGEDTAYPYSLDFQGIPSGVYTITAVATDNLGVTTTSSPILLTTGIIQPQNYITPLVGAVTTACSYSNSGKIVKLTDTVNNALQYQIDVNDNGRYALGVYITNARLGRSVQWLVDGAPAAVDSLPLASYALPIHKLSDTLPVWLPPFDLSAGTHTITLKFTGNVDTLNYISLMDLNYQEIPGTMSANSYSCYGSDTIPTAALNTAYAYTDKNGVSGVAVTNLNKNWVAYAVNVDSAGTYQLSMRLSNRYSNSGWTGPTITYGAAPVTTMRVDVLVDTTYQLSLPFPSYTWNSGSTVIGFGTASTPTFNFATPGKHILKIYFYGNVVSFDSLTFTLVKSLPPTLTVWNGAYDTLWNNTNNWNNGLPSASTSAIIPSIAALPTVNDTEAVHNLVVYNKAAVNNMGNLNIWDSLSNNGLIYGSGLVSLIGTSAQLILGNGTISNLMLNNSHGASIAPGSNSLAITGTLNLLSGTLNTNGNLTLRSSSLATASITPIMSGTGIAGNITVQRYIPAKATRKYALLSSPVSQLISNAWQQQVYITGSGAGGQVCGSANSNGFDVTQTNKPSFYTYNAPLLNNTRWVSIPNTNATSLTPGVGYLVMIRGSRGNGGGCNNQLNTYTPAAPDSVVLSATGAYNTSPTANVYGTTSTGSTSSAYTLLGNPFPAALSATAFLNANSSLITNNIWMLAINGNNTNGYGSWNKATKISTGYWPNDYVADNATDLIIPSGSAFFVERTAAADAAVSFSEQQKISLPKNGVSIFGVGGSNAWNDKVRVTLANTDSTFIDDAVALFGDDAQISDTAYTIFDTYSLNMGNPQFIALVKGGLPLAVSTMKTPLLPDSIQLHVHSSSTGNLQIRFSQYELFNGNISINLWDKFLNKVLDIRANPSYGFAVTADTNSQGANRFVLVVNKSNTLAIDAISLAAIKANGAVGLAWQTSFPGLDTFIIEASTDGQLFSAIGTVKGIDSVSRYTFSINKSLVENSYYRIKAIGKTSKVWYSNTVFIQGNPAKASIVVYPNPLSGNAFSLYLKGFAAGRYEVVLYDMIGKKIEQLPLIHNGVKQDYNLMLQNKLAAGMYKLVVKNADSGEAKAQLSVEEH